MVKVHMIFMVLMVRVVGSSINGSNEGSAVCNNKFSPDIGYWMSSTFVILAINLAKFILDLKSYYLPDISDR